MGVGGEGLAEDAQDLAAIERQRHVAHRARWSVGGLQRDRQILDLEQPAHRRRAKRGSIRSRSPSPIRLRPSTAIAIAAPGKIASRGAWYKKVCASLSMRPQLGSGGWVPSPR